MILEYKQPIFTVIMPTANREKEILQRAVNSVIAQTFQDWELLVIDDFSRPTAAEKIDTKNDIRVFIIRQGRHTQRLIARNTGLRHMNGEWVVFMDDDDELLPNYMEVFHNEFIKRKQESVFYCEADFWCRKTGKYLRKLEAAPFPLSENKGEIHAWFKSGRITTGQFIFHRRCLEKTGLYPDTNSYGEFAQIGGVPGYGDKPPDNRHDKPWVEVMGNPWGDDFYLMYKLTRHYFAVPIKQVLYKKWCR